jgi:hypothetical protein
VLRRRPLPFHVFALVVFGIALVTGLAIELTGVADSERPAAKRAGAAKAAAPPRPQLPGGGRRLLRQAKAYERKTRPVLPAMELLATIATFDAGEEGLYRRRTTNQVIRRYLDAARDIGAILLLDIQPGRADFFSETVALERWLREPDVSLALDPEWRVTEGQVPGQVIGRVEPREVNATTAWLDQLTAKHDLPQKLVVIHQFTDDMVDATQLKPRDNVAIVLNADGFGGRAVKESKYHAFTEEGEGFETGFKLFYEEDVGLMKPAQVLRLRPPPDLVVYE